MRACAPGRGTSAAYRAQASAYYRALAAAQQQMAMAEAAALAQQKDLLRRATTPAARLAAAEQAYKQGKIKVAGRIYVSLASARNAGPIAAEARLRLERLADEARQKLKQIDAKLAEKGSILSPGESSDADGPSTPKELAERWEKLVAESFQEYDQLARDYGGVPAVKSELKKHVAKQRRRNEFSAVLNEPEAKILWEEGQRHEEEDHLCCAYWVYKAAAKLAPARSAGLARRRLAEMDEDPQIVASAAACREIQECHKIYNRAEKLRQPRPTRAKELFAQIVDRAPADSEVHRAALTHLHQMK